MVLVGGPNPDWAVVESTRGRAVSRLINSTMVSKPAPWVQTCLLKMALLNLGPEWCFISSYPDPKALTMAFAHRWLLNYCYYREIHVGYFLFHLLANIMPTCYGLLSEDSGNLYYYKLFLS